MENMVSRRTIWVVCVVAMYIFCFCVGLKELRIGYITGTKFLTNVSTLAFRKHGTRLSGAIKLAIDQINNSSSILPNHYLTLKMADTHGNEDYSIKRTIELLSRNVSVIIGPEETCHYEGRIAASYNLPMISYIPMEAGYLFDATWLYAKAAHEVIEDGGQPNDGKRIFERLRDRNYMSIIGYRNRIDHNGDSEGNYTIVARRSRVIADGQTAWGMHPIGVFKRAGGENLTVSYFENETMQWVGGAPPLDEPVCGYFGKKCIKPESHTWKIVVGVLAGIALTIMIIGFFIYRTKNCVNISCWKENYRLARED